MADHGLWAIARCTHSPLLYALGWLSTWALAVTEWATTHCCYLSSKRWHTRAPQKVWRSYARATSSHCFRAWICRFDIKVLYRCSQHETRLWSQASLQWVGVCVVTAATTSCSAAIHKIRVELSSESRPPQARRENEGNTFVKCGRNLWWQRFLYEWRPQRGSNVQTHNKLLLFVQWSTALTGWRRITDKCYHVDSYSDATYWFPSGDDVHFCDCIDTIVSLSRICRLSFWREKDQHCL